MESDNTLLRMQVDVNKAYDLLKMFKEGKKARIDIPATVQLWDRYRDSQTSRVLQFPAPVAGTGQHPRPKGGGARSAAGESSQPCPWGQPRSDWGMRGTRCDSSAWSTKKARQTGSF